MSSSAPATGADCGEVSVFHRSAAKTRGVTKLALDQLVAGPTADERARGAGSVFTARTAGAVRSVDLDDGLLVVDFRDIRADLGNASTSCGSEALLAQLNSTVFQFSTVHRVRYQINGSCDAFAELLQRDCTVYQRQPTGPASAGPDQSARVIIDRPSPTGSRATWTRSSARTWSLKARSATVSRL